jgi:hypothetical protein
MRVIGVAGTQTMPGDPSGKYVVSCDVDAHEGRGFAVLDDDPNKAMHFANAGQAMRYYRRISTVMPVRPDGAPNRPLTAYHVEVHPINEPSLKLSDR